MDLQHLRTFVAAYEEANFTKAAHRLNATQPGVSVQIAALEATIGASLFDRNARSVTPTLVGQRLYPRALKILQDLKSTALEIKSMSKSARTRVRIGISPALSKAILAPVLTRYVDTHPQVDLRVVETHEDTLLGAIESHELDLALTTEPPDSAPVSYRRVFSDRLLIVSGARCGLDAHQSIELNVAPHFKIVVPSMSCRALHRTLEEPLRSGRIIPERLIELDGVAGVLDFLASSDWIALLPAATAHNHPRRSGVRFNAIAGEEIAVNYCVVHGRTDPISPAAQAFVDLATAELMRVEARSRTRVLTRTRVATSHVA
jgi:LysR family nitrogen assimilation transcriptional regulator